MEACRMCIACVSRTEFPRLPLRVPSESRGMGKRRTAFLSRLIFAARSSAPRHPAPSTYPSDS